MMQAIEFNGWSITSTHGPDCKDCRWAVHRAESRIVSAHGLAHTAAIVIRYFGHDATAKRKDA